MNFSLSRKSSSSQPKKRRQRSPEGGIALVSVLWLLLLLSGLAATTAYIVRIDALLARRGYDLARAQAAADAAIVDMISRIADERADHRPTLDAVRTWEFNGISTATAVTNEASRIDVNSAPDGLVLAFFQAQGISETTATLLLKALRTYQGAPMDSPTLAAQTPSGGIHPLHPLVSVEELKQIPEWHEQNIECWMSALTVYSGQPEVSPSSSAPGAMAALQWLQDHHPDRPPLPSPSTANGAPAPRPLAGEVLRIRTSATSSDVNASSEWIGRVTGDLANPVLTMRWEHTQWSESKSCAPAQNTG